MNDGADAVRAPTPQHEDTRRRFVAIAHEAGLPDPDEIEYRDTEIEFVWHAEKLVIVLDEIPVADLPW